MVIFSKGQANEVSSSGNGASVSFKDLILDEDVSLDADLVVLDLGMVPNSGPDPYAANESQEGMSDEEKDEADAAAEIAIPADSILALDYRQGSDLPQLKSHHAPQGEAYTRSRQPGQNG